jgi:hypothetical protein
LLVVLSTQTSGLLHDVADIAATIATGADAPHDDDCVGEHGDCDCPPGCPNCHSSHGAGSLPPASLATELSNPMDGIEVAGVAYDGLAPPLPELDSLYRPPRVIARA